MSDAPVVCANLADERRFTPSSFIRDHGFVSGLVMSMGRGGHEPVVIEAWDARRREFGNVEIGLVERSVRLLEVTLADAAENGRLRNELDRTSALAEIGRVMGSSLHIEEVYERFVAQASRLIPFDQVNIISIDHERWRFRIAYDWGVAIQREPGVWSPLAGTNKELVIRTRTGLLIDDRNLAELSSSTPTMKFTLDAGLKSCVAVPLIWKDKVVGVLTFRSTESAAYTDRDLETAHKIGSVIAGAIANGELHAEVQRYAHEREVLAQIGRIAGASTNVEEVYEHIADQIKRLVPFDRLSISTVEPHTRTVERRFFRGLEVPDWHLGTTAAVGPLTDAVMRKRRGVIRFAGVPHPDFGSVPFNDAGTTAGLASALAVPLIAGNEPIGAMCLRACEPNLYTDHDLELAMRISEQIAGAVASSRLQTELLDNIRERALLEEAFRSACDADSREKLVERVGRAVSRLVNFDRLSVVLNNPSQQEVANSITLEPAFGAGPAAWVAKVEPEPVRWDWIAEARIESQGTVTTGRGSERGSSIYCPLITGGNPLGLLTVQSYSGDPYSDRQLNIVRRIAGPIALALHRFHLLDIATTIPNGVHAPAIARESPAQHPSEHSMSSGAAMGDVSRKRETYVGTLLVGQQMIRRAIASSLAGVAQIVGEAETCADAVANCPAVQPEVLICHLADGQRPDPAFLAAVRNRWSRTPILVVSDTADPELLWTAQRAGVSGFVTLSEGGEDLAAILPRVARGETVIAGNFKQIPTDTRPPATAGSEVRKSIEGQDLTERDRAILSLIAHGMSNSEVGADLHLAVGTVRNRLMAIYRKIGATDRAEAVYIATRSGLVD